MVDLANSTRISYKATYAPSTVKPEEQPQIGRAVEKLALVRNLDVQPQELEQLRGLAAQLDAGLLDLIERLRSDPSLDALQRHGPAIAAIPMDYLAALGMALAELRRADSAEAAAHVLALTESLSYRATIEPVGWLHLERLQMTPVGIEHGELVYSVPLTPKETVNITHREWTVTTQTFENLVQDSLEGFSETGVTEKTDLTQATDTQSKHSSALDVNGAMSATYNGGAYSVTASAGVDYKQQSDDSQSRKDSVAHSVAITKQASSRTRKEHKQSFRVSSVAGAEDLAVRVLRNPSDTDAMRVDYFQLLRRWQVDLIRYGLRMTYDLVIPSPGLDLVQRVLELQRLDAELAGPFVFDVKLSDVTRDRYEDLAAQYGVSVDRPPEAVLYQQFHKEFSIDNKDAASVPKFDAFEFDVDPDYHVNTAFFTADVVTIHTHVTWAHELVVVGKGNILQAAPGTGSVYVDQLNNLYGPLDVQYYYVGLWVFSVHLSITTTLKEEAFAAWQLRTWSALRQAAHDAYLANQQLLKARRDSLAAQIGEFDALTLRKMEHEEIMRAVLVWLLGPTFKLMPDEIASLFQGYPDPMAADPPEQAYRPVDQLTVPQWKDVLQSRGELIKFLHNAIEWENVLFFVYPYFWDHAGNWPFKRFLVHPDPVHREFLRSGCARVVLTVRPGFELAFAYLLETGDATKPPSIKTPYVSVAEETRNYAMTNYQNIPPANPDHNVRELLYPEQRAAWADIQALMLLLERYRGVHGRYPSTDEGLAALTQLPGNPTVPSTDPWGNAYHYRRPGLHNDYDLASYGADGKPGGTGRNSDITSWAEGSVIGRWYEYTPTSALDVSINTVLPTKPEPA